jgi:16S rRNA (cytosine967-C5)-methyltransferase
MIAPARLAAFEILAAVSAGRADLPAAVAAARRTLADERDQALASEIAIGVERWRAALDHLIVHFARRPLERLDAEIVAILRLSIYQLVYLARVPAAAIVNDAVDLAGREGKRSAAGLVNAVLRSISRRRDSLPLPARPTDPAHRAAALDYLSISLSHPRWLVARWHDRCGFEATRRWLEFNNRAAPLTLRANPIHSTRDELSVRLAADGIVTKPGRFGPDALVVIEGSPLRHPGTESGLFVVQDEAAQLVTLLAGPRPGPRILDTCASPGGKTSALAASVRTNGLVVACDVRDRRMALLRQTIRMTGVRNVRLVQADLLAPLPFSTRFDCVFVDVPCSGLGILRRDPDIRWRRRESDLQPMAASELQMLRHAADRVRVGGRLVYATCSSEPEENEEVAEAFLRASPSFDALDARAAHPLLPVDVVDQRGRLRTEPPLHGLEAFFGAVFVRRR